MRLTLAFLWLFHQSVVALDPVGRRQVLACPPWLVASAPWTRPANAASLDPSPAAGLRENVAQVASKVPGYGQPDVFYPPLFQGVWVVEKLVTAVQEGGPAGSDDEIVTGAEATAKKLLGSPISYRIRFIEHRGNIVADRNFNGRNEFDAWNPAVQTTASSWEPDNANVQTLTFRDGLVREIKVTKRSFENPSEDTFGTSEYARLADAGVDGPLGSVPKLSAKRALVRYRITDRDTVEGIELQRYYPAVSLNADPDAVLTIKSRFVLRREK